MAMTSEPSTPDGLSPEDLPPGADTRPGELDTLPRGVAVTHHFTRVGERGAVVHYVTAGPSDGTPVLVVHGLGETWWAWHAQIEAMALRHRVVAIDLPGFGQSDTRLDLDHSPAGHARLVAELLAELDLQRIHLVAHDRGSVLADHLAAGAPHLVASYVRMQQAGAEPPPRGPARHRWLATEEGRVAMAHPGFTGELFGGDRTLALPIPGRTLTRLRGEWLRTGVAEAVSAHYASSDPDNELVERRERLFPALAMPVLFLHGADDPELPPDELGDLAGQVHHGAVQFVDAGHYLHLEDPVRVNDILLEWLAQF